MVEILGECRSAKHDAIGSSAEFVFLSDDRWCGEVTALTIEPLGNDLLAAAVEPDFCDPGEGILDGALTYIDPDPTRLDGRYCVRHVERTVSGCTHDFYPLVIPVNIDRVVMQCGQVCISGTVTQWGLHQARWPRATQTLPGNCGELPS